MKKIFASLLIVLLVIQNLSFAVGGTTVASANENVQDVLSGTEVNMLITILDVNKVVNIVEASTAYKLLSSAEKKLVTADNVKKLQNAEKAHAKAIDFVKAYNAIVFDKTFAAKTKTAYTKFTTLTKLASYVTMYEEQLATIVENVKDYNELQSFMATVTAYKVAVKTYSNAQGYVDTYNDLLENERSIIDTASVGAVAKKITELQSIISNVTEFDDLLERSVNILDASETTFVTKLNTVSDVKTAYAALTKTEITVINKKYYDKITAFEKANKEIVNVKALIDSIKLDEKNFSKTVKAAKTAYDNLEKKQKNDATKIAQLQSDLGDSYTKLLAYSTINDIVTKSTSLKLNAYKDLVTYQQVKALVDSYETTNTDLQAMLTLAQDKLAPHTEKVKKVEAYVTSVNEALAKPFAEREAALKAITNSTSKEDAALFKKLVDPALQKAMTNVAKDIAETKNLQQQFDAIELDAANFIKAVTDAEKKYEAFVKGKTNESVAQLQTDLGESYTAYTAYVAVKNEVSPYTSVKLAAATDVVKVTNAYNTLQTIGETLPDILVTAEYNRIQGLYESLQQVLYVEERITEFLNMIDSEDFEVSEDTITDLIEINDLLTELGTNKKFVTAKKVTAFTKQVTDYKDVIAARKAIAEFDLASADYVANATKLMIQVEKLKLKRELIGHELNELYSQIVEEVAGPLVVSEEFNGYVSVDNLRNLTIVNTIEKDVLVEALKNDAYEVQVKTATKKLTAKDTVIITKDDKTYTYKLKVTTKKKYTGKSLKVNLKDFGFDSIISFTSNYDGQIQNFYSSYDYTFSQYIDNVRNTTIDYLKYKALDYNVRLSHSYLEVNKDIIKHVPNAKDARQFTLTALAPTGDSPIYYSVVGLNKSGEALAKKYEVSADASGVVKFEYIEDFALIQPNDVQLNVDFHKTWIDLQGMPKDLFIRDLNSLYDVSEDAEIADIIFGSELDDYAYHVFYNHYEGAIQIIPILDKGTWDGIDKLDLTIMPIFTDGSIGEATTVSVTIVDEPVPFEPQTYELDYDWLSDNIIVYTDNAYGENTINLGFNEDGFVSNEETENFLKITRNGTNVSLTTLAQTKPTSVTLVTYDKYLEDRMYVEFYIYPDGSIQFQGVGGRRYLSVNQNYLEKNVVLNKDADGKTLGTLLTVGDVQQLVGTNINLTDYNFSFIVNGIERKSLKQNAIPNSDNTFMKADYTSTGNSEYSFDLLLIGNPGKYYDFWEPIVIKFNVIEQLN